MRAHHIRSGESRAPSMLVFFCGRHFIPRVFIPRVLFLALLWKLNRLNTERPKSLPTPKLERTASVKMSSRKSEEHLESKIIIRNYPPETTERDMRIMFEKYGKIEDCEFSLS